MVPPSQHASEYAGPSQTLLPGTPAPYFGSGGVGGSSDGDSGFFSVFRDEEALGSQ